MLLHSWKEFLSTNILFLCDADISVVDKDGNAVSLTSTINTPFGSGVLSPSTGILLNNEMDDFATPLGPDAYGLSPSEANFISPGKRPLSSMSPTMVFHPPGYLPSDSNATNSTDATDSTDSTSPGPGSLFMVLGAGGGPKIVTATLQTFLNHAFLGYGLYESLARPRVHDQLLRRSAPEALYDFQKIEEAPVPKTYLQLSIRERGVLRRRGHDLLPHEYLGSCQDVAIDLESGDITAVSDAREGGAPAGY